MEQKAEKGVGSECVVSGTAVEKKKKSCWTSSSFVLITTKSERNGRPSLCLYYRLPSACNCRYLFRLLFDGEKLK